LQEVCIFQASATVAFFFATIEQGLSNKLLATLLGNDRYRCQDNYLSSQNNILDKQDVEPLAALKVEEHELRVCGDPLPTRV